MEWRVGDGGRWPPEEHLHSHPGLAQSYRPTRPWRRFYRIRLSFDQRRAGAQPGVATVQIRPAPPTSLYILPTFWRTGENPREMRHSFSSQRNRESRLTPDSADSASILSVQNRNGSLQRLNALWAAFARPSPLRDRQLNFDRSGLFSEKRHHFGATRKPYI
jgi:hypothetical protein